MTSRREFLQIGLTATAWPIVAQAAHAPLHGYGGQAAGVDPGQGTPLLGVVYDTRFAESVAFATRSAALGLRAHAIDGDMTRLWYDEIYHHWKQGPTALAGLTAHGPLFCFGELARDVGMRVVFRAEHTQAGGRGVMPHGAALRNAALRNADTLYSWVIAPASKAGVEGVAGWLFPQE